jgi:Flp pilus assembly protein CpaB
VDVLVFLGSGNGITSPMTKTILTDVTVFAVNEHINREVQGDGTTIQARTVSVLVKPEQVERLMLATELGKLQLSLRRADDDVPADSTGASLADLHITEGGSQEINVPAAEPQQDSLGAVGEHAERSCRSLRAGGTLPDGDLLVLGRGKHVTT